MSLKAVYERFLTSPNPLSLSEKVTLNYIPTLKTFSQPGPLICHLESQSKNEVRKKADKVIAAVEGQRSLSLDIETTLEFISGGGAYLPGLDNFVTDRIVTFPTIHIVNFDNEDKIQRIRIYWDQASLLRQVDVIGSRGKNWPIADGKDQTRLIASVVAHTTTDSPVARGREMEDSPAAPRSFSPSKKRIQDPHASLALFAGQEKDENSRKAQPAMIAPRASAKPAQRDYSELFAAGNEEYETSRGGSASPNRAHHKPTIAPKGAGASKYQPSRLFEEDASENLPAKYKSNPAKYNHFDLGEASENDHFQHANPASTKDVPMRAKTNKHLSQWDFEDFVTPEKTRHRVRGQDVRHFGWSDDEGENVETPGKQPNVVQPRPDARAHFEFQDDGTPDASQHRPRGKPKGLVQNANQGLYQNNLYDDGTEVGKSGYEKEPLNAVTTNVGRTKAFDQHWVMADHSSPATANEKVNNENRPMAGDRKKAVQMMDAHWESYDQSPNQDNTAVNSKPVRKGMESHWGFGDEDTAPKAKSRTGEKNYWDF